MLQAAFGQCKVDRTASGVTMQARVAAALEHLDAPAAPGEQGGEQGAGEAGADDGEGFWVSAFQIRPHTPSFPRKREPSVFAFGDPAPKIVPVRIHGFDPFDLPCAPPFLESRKSVV